MIAVRTQLARQELPEDRRPVREAIERAVPLSAGAANRTVSRQHTELRLAELRELAEQAGFDPASYAARWELQLGTLGSGNHFIEVTVDELDRVWLFLHSGSRGVGNRIAQKHILVAQAYCKQHWIELPDRDLAYLVEGTDEFAAYIREMRWAQHYALLNREEMMDRVAVLRVGRAGRRASRGDQLPPQLHRAGDPLRSPCVALPEGRDQRRDRTAGTDPRVDGHRVVRRELEYRDTDAFIDEIPAAYKDIDQVMADAADLVEIRHTLRQIVNVKGD